MATKWVEGKRTDRDVRAGGDDGHGLRLGVVEGGGAEERGHAQASLRRRHKGVDYVHRPPAVPEHVL